MLVVMEMFCIWAASRPISDRDITVSQNVTLGNWVKGAQAVSLLTAYELTILSKSLIFKKEKLFNNKIQLTKDENKFHV